jgi:hypothetical protein
VSRAEYGDTAGQGRFPLRPGKPLVHRRHNGKWGWTCYCIGHHNPARSLRPHMQARHNCDSWQHAFREAVDHVKYFHKTREQYETEALEALYALPAAEYRSTP